MYSPYADFHLFDHLSLTLEVNNFYMTATPSRPKEPNIKRVSSLELFFDLVFVFTITQITGLVSHPHSPTDYLRAALVFITLM